MVPVSTRRCGKYRTLLQIPKYGAQSESGKDFFETQLRVYVPGFGALLSFIRCKTIRCRKRQRKSAFRLRPPRRGSFTPKRPCANRKCCARSRSPVGIASRPGRGVMSSLVLPGVNVRSIRYCNQFQIVRRKDFPFRVLHFQSAHGFSGTFVQNLKTFLAAGEEITFSPLTQSNDDREQLSAFWG